MHTLISAKPSSTSSLVSAMPSMPDTLTTWRTRQASNQPQRRLRPGVDAELLAALAEALADRVGELGRERARADARGVGLGEAQHVADRARPHAGAGRRLRRHRVGRGDERIGAVVDVEQRALRALEQDALARAALAVEQRPHVVDVGQDLRRDLGELAHQRVLADLGHAEPAPQRVVVHEQAVDLGAQRAEVLEVLDADGAPARPCPRRPGRCRARWCRSCCSPAAASRSWSSSRCSGRISVAFSAILQVARRRRRRPALLQARRSRRPVPRDRPRRRCR